MKYIIQILLIVLLVIFHSSVFAQIKVGVLPIEFKGSKVSSQFKEKLKNRIYQNLKKYPQIEPVFIFKKNKDSSFSAILYISLNFFEDKTKVELKLIDNLSSEYIYNFQEDIFTSEIWSKMDNYCEKIREILISKYIYARYSPKKSFLSKINFLDKIKNSFSKIIFPKKEFDIKIFVPPPPPPPSYIYYSQEVLQKSQKKSSMKKDKCYSWQWL